MPYRKFALVAALMTLLSACGGPRYFVIQGYPEPARPASETFTVRSQNGFMKLLKVDGRKGKYIPIASGAGAYAGFDLRLLPGRHQIVVYCWIDTYLSSTHSDDQVIELDGQAGEVQEVSCTPTSGQFLFAVRQVVPPQT